MNASVINCLYLGFTKTSASPLFSLSFTALPQGCVVPPTSLLALHLHYPPHIPPSASPDILLFSRRQPWTTSGCSGPHLSILTCPHSGWTYSSFVSYRSSLSQPVLACLQAYPVLPQPVPAGLFFLASSIGCPGLLQPALACRAYPNLSSAFLHLFSPALTCSCWS